MTDKEVDSYIKELITFIETAQSVQCFEPDMPNLDEYVYIVHFNAKGHDEMARILYEKLD